MYKNILFIAISTLFMTPLQSQDGEVSEELKTNIQSLIESDNVIGMVIGTSRGGEESYYSKGLQSKTGGTVDAKSIFEIGSISKTFTGLLLADMVIQGKVKLDDDIQNYLPEGIKAPMYDGKSIKLFHLSNHTSGLPRLPTNFNPADPSNPYNDLTEESVYQSINDYELTREIGSTYEYSNLAAGLLGHILATASGTTYEALLRTKILEPLAMENTGITNVEGDLANGHMGGLKVPNWDFGAIQGAGAIRSSAADMMRYLEANMGVLESEIYPAMQLAHKNSGAEGSNPIVGLGWHTMNYNGQEVIWHNGGTGGYTSFMGWIKGSDKGVVVLNNSTENVDYIGLNVLLPTYPLKVIRKSIELDDSILETYLGNYELAPGFVLTVSQEGSQLSAQATGQGALPIYPESEATFFYKVIEAQLVFQKDESGKVESVTLYQAGQEILGKRLD